MSYPLDEAEKLRRCGNPILTFNFLGGPPPVAPFPACGPAGGEVFRAASGSRQMHERLARAAGFGKDLIDRRSRSGPAEPWMIVG